MPKVKFLDCTLRDGGYYTNWHFSNEIVRNTISGLDRAGVDIIEVGYKSIDKNQFNGLYKYCNESLLSWLNEHSGPRMAFMIDLKEFSKGDGSLNLELLSEQILNQEESVFSMVRLAIRLNQIDSAIAAIDFFNEKGYSIALNIMGGSLIELDDLSDALAKIEGLPIEALYLADSFGSFYPDDVSKYYQCVKEVYTGKLGFHAHDNQGLAFINALTAMKEGVEYIDGTIYGMGRGAGNLRTEQFLLCMREKYDLNQYEPFYLLDTLNKDYLPLHKKFQWGSSYVYMMSGLNDIHQSYVQEISDHKQYSLSQISRVVHTINREDRSKFQKSKLDEALLKVVKQGDEGQSKKIQLSNNIELGDTVVITANGPGLSDHLEGVLELVNKLNCELIECNDTGKLRESDNRILVILNRVRLLEVLTSRELNTKLFLTGEEFLPSKIDGNRVLNIPYELGAPSKNSNKVKIMNYEAGQLCISWAIHVGVKNIYLAGFDGYESESSNSNMNEFLKKIRMEFSEVNIASITPSTYSYIDKTSVYALL